MTSNYSQDGMAPSRDLVCYIEQEIHDAHKFSQLVRAGVMIEGLTGWRDKRRLRDLLDGAWARFFREQSGQEPPKGCPPWVAQRAA